MSQGQGQGCQWMAQAAEVVMLDLTSRALARVCARRAVPVSTATLEQPPARPAVPVSTAPAQRDPLRVLHAALGSMAAVPQARHHHRQCARRAVPVSTAAPEQSLHSRAVLRAK